MESYNKVLIVLQHMSVPEARALRTSFVKLCQNPKTPDKLITAFDLCSIYLTQESIVNKFHEVFGYRNENLALRFYNYLSDGYNQVHIYLPTFYIKL